MNNKLDRTIRSKIDSFIEGMEKGELNEDWVVSIEALIKGDRDAQVYYIEKIALIGHLEWSLKSEATFKAYQQQKPKVVSIKEHKIKKSQVAIYALAALLLFSIGMNIYMSVPHAPPKETISSVALTETVVVEDEMIDEVDEKATLTLLKTWALYGEEKQNPSSLSRETMS